MAKAKTTKKAPAPKAKVTKKAPAKRAPAPKSSPAKAASVIDVEALDRARDDEALDGQPTALADHAEALADTVDEKRRKLAKAKVTPDDAARLRALAAVLRKRETAWLNQWKSSGNGAVAAARGPARAGRDQIFSALRVFANGARATQAALDDIAGVENDSDLLEDLDRLLALAKAHRDDLAGTDTDEDFVAATEAATATFRRARTAALAAGGAASNIELTDEAREARRVRNRVFWALADLDRAVCAKGSHAYRTDPKGLRLFAAYTHRTRRAKKNETPTPTPAPTG